jgi:hypothetical protein
MESPSCRKSVAAHRRIKIVLEDIRMAKRMVFVAALILAAGFFVSRLARADQVSVRYTEGLQHGFVAVRTLDGKALGAGDLTQTVDGDRVTTKLSVKFKDGSQEEETTVFSQHDKFQVIQYRIVQKGPAFKNPIDASIDAATGQISGHYTGSDGQDKALNAHLDLAPDLANGMVPILLENIMDSGAQANVSMVAFTPKPRLVKLAIAAQGDDPVSIGGFRRKAKHFVVKVELGSVAGAIAPLIGKQPPDINVWVLGGEAPVFLRSEGPLFSGGPIWSIEFIGPTWTAARRAHSTKHP